MSDEVAQEQIVAAIKQLANGKTLEKKPNVKDIEKITGDITAAQRDEAFETYQAELEADDADDNEPNADGDDSDSDADAGNAAADAPAVESDHPVVTNESKQSLSIRGVKILPGQSAPVPKFKADHPIMKRWIDAGIISVK